MRERRVQCMLSVVVCVLVMFSYLYWVNLPSNINTNEDADKQRKKHFSKPVTTMEYMNKNTQLTNGDKFSAMKNIVINNTSTDQALKNALHADKILRESIEMIHLSNLKTPSGETCQKRLPAAIIIGVHKSGTRELLEFMHLHPHIQIYSYNDAPNGVKYEMRYFSTMYERGATWFKEQMPCSFTNQLTVMKMSTYFHDRLVPERIQKLNESIKLILIVREPIARAYSDYTFYKSNMERLGKKKSQKYLKTFSDFVINKTNNKVRMENEHVMYSVYDDYMEHWLKYFSLSQFLILEHSELIRDPVSTLKTVEKFLGLGDFITPDMFVRNSEKGFYCIKSNLTSTGMSCYGENRGRTQEPIDQGTRLKLTQFFAGRNRRFFDMIGKSYDW